MHKCDLCGAAFEKMAALNGHLGGVHYRKLGPIRHGTVWGYQQHLKRKIPTCLRCKKAQRVAVKNWRAGVRKPVA